MGWYDDQTNSVGALCARLSGDAAAVQGVSLSSLLFRYSVLIKREKESRCINIFFKLSKLI